jgi:hypothetical protein
MPARIEIWQQGTLEGSDRLLSAKLAAPTAHRFALNRISPPLVGVTSTATAVNF